MPLGNDDNSLGIPQPIAPVRSGGGGIGSTVPMFGRSMKITGYMPDGTPRLEPASNELRTIMIQGVGKIQVPAEYDDAHIKQHIQTLRQTKPEMFSAAGQAGMAQPGEKTPFDQKVIGKPENFTPGGGPVTMQARDESSPVKNWIEDFRSDLEYGGGRTTLGGLANKVLPQRGAAAVPGHKVLGGPVLGPIDMAHGAATIPEHPVRGINEMVRGAGETVALPAAVANPAMIGESLPYIGASKAGEGLTSLVTDDPDYQELGGNVAALGLHPAVKGARVGTEKALSNPYVRHALTWGTLVEPLWQAAHGNLAGAGEGLGVGVGARLGLEGLRHIPDVPLPGELGDLRGLYDLGPHYPDPFEGKTVEGILGNSPKQAKPAPAGHTDIVDTNKLPHEEVNTKDTVERNVVEPQSEEPFPMTHFDPFQNASEESILGQRLGGSEEKPGFKDIVDTNDKTQMKPEEPGFKPDKENPNRGTYTRPEKKPGFGTAKEEPTRPAAKSSEETKVPPSDELLDYMKDKHGMTEEEAQAFYEQESPKNVNEEDEQKEGFFKSPYSYEQTPEEAAEERQSFKDFTNRLGEEAKPKKNRVPSPKPGKVEDEDILSDIEEQKKGPTSSRSAGGSGTEAGAKADNGDIAEARKRLGIGPDEYHKDLLTTAQKVKDERLGTVAKPVEVNGVTLDEKALSQLSDKQLRAHAYKAGIDVEEGESAKTLIPKILKDLQERNKPEVKEIDIEQALKDSINARKPKRTEQ